MGFLSGSTTFERFRISDDPTGQFGEEHLEILTSHQIGTAEVNLFEQSDIGFCAGAHLLDTQFSMEKNIIGQAMHFGIRTDSIQVPAPIKNAWMQMELAGLMGDNAGGKPSKAKREEAKEAVEARCAAEAKKGNFRRMNETSVLWDATSETLFLGSTSEKANDSCLDLLNRAFGLEFSRLTSGKLASEFADEFERNNILFSTSSTQFLPDDNSREIVWWNGMNDNYDYMGNEFLLWLWWTWETGSDTLLLADDSEVSGMFARSLSLDCPQGEHGKESISSDSPVQLPEATLAVRMGKLPRKAGLTLVRNGEQFDLTVQAETFAISSARISQIGDSTDGRDMEDRIESIRQMAATVDLLYATFCEKRLSKAWSAESGKVTRWLQNDSLPAKRRTAA